MILARHKETFKNMDVYILTFDTGPMSYEHLIKDLKNKWFGDLDVNIQHFTDFLKWFTNEHEVYLTPKQIEYLQKAQKGIYYPTQHSRRCSDT